MNEALSKAIEDRVPLYFDAGDGRDRYMAEVFEIPDGIAWVDPGWQADFMGHPVHKLTGEIKQIADYEWQIGDVTIGRTVPGLQSWGQREIWEDYLKEHPETTRVKAMREVANFFEMPLAKIKP